MLVDEARVDDEARVIDEVGLVLGYDTFVDEVLVGELAVLVRDEDTLVEDRVTEG